MQFSVRNSFLPATVALITLNLFLAPPAGAEMSRHSIEHNGVQREYFVMLPDLIPTDAKLPVVLGLHGYTSTATGFASGHGLDRHAAKHGYIGVFPQGSTFQVNASDDPGSSRTQLITSWNDLAANQADSAGVQHCLADRHVYPCPPDCGNCSRCMWTSCGDDLGFLDQVLEEVRANYPTDEDRYYVLGVSNGAMMALRLACARSSQFAAVSAIIGQLAPGFACQPKTQLPLLHLTGALDNTVREDGRPAADGFMYETAEHTRAHWAEALQCETLEPWLPLQKEATGLQCEAWRDCKTTDHEVVGCSDPQGAHAWPGAQVGDGTATCVSELQHASLPNQPICPPSQTEDITDWGIDLVWHFFTRYTRDAGKQAK